MNILVTGGTGFIGSHTIVSLLNEGHHVITFDNFYNSKETVVEAIEHITGKSFVFYRADMTQPELLEKIFRENQIDCVIHFAGYKAVGESVEMPLSYYHNNVYGTLCLLEKMKQHGVSVPQLPSTGSRSRFRFGRIFRLALRTRMAEQS